MKLEEIASSSNTKPAPALAPVSACNVRSDIPPVQSNHPDVQELIVRFHANQELDCLALDRGELAFIGAIYMEVVHDPDFHPTPEILELIRTVNAQMRLSSEQVAA